MVVNIVYARSTFDASITNSKDHSTDCSIADENGRPQCFNLRDVFDSIVWLNHGTHACVPYITLDIYMYM